MFGKKFFVSSLVVTISMFLQGCMAASMGLLGAAAGAVVGATALQPSPEYNVSTGEETSPPFNSGAVLLGAAIVGGAAFLIGAAIEVGQMSDSAAETEDQERAQRHAEWCSANEEACKQYQAQQAADAEVANQNARASQEAYNNNVARQNCIATGGSPVDVNGWFMKCVSVSLHRNSRGETYVTDQDGNTERTPEYD